MIPSPEKCLSAPENFPDFFPGKQVIASESKFSSPKKNFLSPVKKNYPFKPYQISNIFVLHFAGLAYNIITETKK